MEVIGKARDEYERLKAPNGLAHFFELMRPETTVFETIGLYAQLAATIDLHLRRIYFALRAKGDNERGDERAHLDQIFDRLPAAIAKCDLDLYRKDEFAPLLAIVRKHLSVRNDVVHSSCRWQPDGDFLVFAHANENVGRDIKTGDGIAYWIIPKADLFDIVRSLETIARYISQYSMTWLPTLRPWLQNFWDGKPDPQNEGADALIERVRAFEHARREVPK